MTTCKCESSVPVDSLHEGQVDISLQYLAKLILKVMLVELLFPHVPTPVYYSICPSSTAHAQSYSLEPSCATICNVNSG